MMVNLLYLFISLYLFSGLVAHKGNENKWVIEGEAQGTTYRILYYAPDNYVTKACVDSIFTAIDSSVSLYKPYSLINKFNESEKGINADIHLKKLVAKSREIYIDSEGAFDITIKPIVSAWGFGAEGSRTVPDSAEINQLRKLTGMHHIRLDGDYLSKTSKEVSIDLNGIGQGYSVDLIAEFLDQRGIEHYLVEVGGELRSKGGKPEDGIFNIGIEIPGSEENSATKIIEITNGAITTSGTYRRYFIAKGQRLSHLINPDTGYPVRNTLLSVSVFAESATIADGYDNVFMIWGLEKSVEILAKQEKLGAYFIYRDSKGNLKDTVAGNFPALIQTKE